MGGLVVQRALLDSPDLRERTSHVFLYGTPSAGLKKASWFQIWKRQIEDMADDGDFIEKLRRDWTAMFAEPPFVFRSAAGDKDQFVPPRSALGPFTEEQTGVVLGNHLSMVKPKTANDLSVQLLVSGIQGKAAPTGPWNSARLALETLDFQAVIDRLLPQRGGLDNVNLVTLALALDALGRAAESLEVLEQAGKTGTDAQGVRAGRLKRRWTQGGSQADGERALELYTDAYKASQAAKDWEQAYYHGINVAFMTALFLDDDAAAADLAREVLPQCALAKRDHWCLATQGEAHFYLGEWDTGLGFYNDAIEHGEPREIESMYEQAVLIMARLAPRGERKDLQRRLEAVFGR